MSWTYPSSFLFKLEKRIRAAQQTDTAPWVRDRVILLGDYAYDLSEISLSKLDECELSLLKLEGVENDQEELASRQRLYCFAETQYEYAEHKRTYKTISTRLDGPEKTIFKHWCPDDCAVDDTLPNQIWILRNLSKHEYVRADTLASIDFVPSVEPVGFVNGMMIQAQWTSDPSGVVVGGCKGLRAEDRFGIVTRSLYWNLHMRLDGELSYIDILGKMFAGIQHHVLGISSSLTRGRHVSNHLPGDQTSFLTSFEIAQCLLYKHYDWLAL